MKNRVRRQLTYAMSKAYHECRHWMTDEDYLWEYMAPVGREYGSPDFERLSKIEMLAHGALIEHCADAGCFVGRVPGIVGAYAQGESRQEVISNLQGLLEAMSRRYQGRLVRRDPRKKVLDTECWLHEPIPEDILKRATESMRSIFADEVNLSARNAL